jgi:sulfatase modifying factor 1
MPNAVSALPFQGEALDLASLRLEQIAVLCGWGAFLLVGGCGQARESPAQSGHGCTAGPLAATDGATTMASVSCLVGGPGLSDCGAAAESCCTSDLVTGGAYFRTYPDQDNGFDRDTDYAQVSAFRLDRYDVTVGRYRQFVSAWSNGWMPTPGSGKHSYLRGGLGLAVAGPAGPYESGWTTQENDGVAPTDANLTSCQGGGPLSGYFPSSTWTPTPGTQENLPIVCVSWQEAYAFCIWDGGFLPTETEWEYAAAGGCEQRTFPWGSTEPGTENAFAIYNCNYPVQGMACAGVQNIAPVGTASRGAGLWGQLDLGGNVDQWTMDGYFPYDDCTDCAAVAPADVSWTWVVRGGYFGSYDAYQMLPTWRSDGRSRDYSVGFRCARAP